MTDPTQRRVITPLYGGSFTTDVPTVTLPFVLPDELVNTSLDNKLTSILEPSPDRVPPPCPHFGPCGGCQYQHIDYPTQLNIKRTILQDILKSANVPHPAIQIHSSKEAPQPRVAHPFEVSSRKGGVSSAEALDRTPSYSPETPDPYHYRNRIRLRLQRLDDTLHTTPELSSRPERSTVERPAAPTLRFGYNVRTTTDFLPITTCPISAPNLIPAAEALLATAQEDRDAAHWLNAAREVELFTNHDLSRLQLTLFCSPRTKAPQGSFTRAMNALARKVPELAGAEAQAFDPRTGPTGRVLATHGAAGLAYRVGDETYWITRGGFFQVNRFLIETLVELVTQHAPAQPRTGAIAWDLFAGVGLFSRILARSFRQVTAVEASPTAATDLRAALARLGPQHRAIQQTTLEFLRSAVIQRERPDLIVLDPPRAGGGLEACELLARIAAPQVVYVSCDPTTLARDLQSLQSAGYRLDALHLVDLFPQTFHLETVAVLSR